MSRIFRSAGKRLLAVPLLFLFLLLAWNWPLLVSLLKPVVRPGTPLRVTAVVEAGGKPTPVPAPTFSYPRLGITAPLSNNPDTSPLRSSDWGRIARDLTHGVSAAYDGSSFAKAPLVFVTGHSSDFYPHPYSAIFAALGQWRMGDQFTVAEEGKSWQYQVVGARILNPKDSPAFSYANLEQGMASPTDHLAAVVTCWPPLTTRYRLVVVGKRVSS